MPAAPVAASIHLQVEPVFLTKTLSAAYTPLSIDGRGRIYAQNNGEIYVLGR